MYIIIHVQCTVPLKKKLKYLRYSSVTVHSWFASGALEVRLRFAQGSLLVRSEYAVRFGLVRYFCTCIRPFCSLLVRFRFALGSVVVCLWFARGTVRYFNFFLSGTVHVQIHVVAQSHEFITPGRGYFDVQVRSKEGEDCVWCQQFRSHATSLSQVRADLQDVHVCSCTYMYMYTLYICIILCDTLKSIHVHLSPGSSCGLVAYTCTTVYFLYGTYSYLLIGRD